MVSEWASSLPPGAAVLDLGCGDGVPISRALVESGYAVYGVDASASMVDAFRARFPNCPVECSGVEDSNFYGRSFEGIVAWGLIFLLAPCVQEVVLRRVATAVSPGGKLLFTAPEGECEWGDELTGRTSYSLGLTAYRTLLESEGLALLRVAQDESLNHYYSFYRSV